MLQTIRKSEVPEYLRAGEFYRSLGDEDDDLITIPSQTTKPICSVNSLPELTHLLSSLRFWGVDAIPDEVFDLSFSLFGDEVEWHNLLVEFEVQFPAIKVVQFLLSQEPQHRMRCALEAKSIDIVNYLYRRKYILPKDANVVAARAGSLQCLRFTLMNTERTLTDVCVCSAAALSGYVECLRFAHEFGCNWSANTCTNAARSGRVECLQYLHENGCPWDESTCTHAAQNGHLRCLQYAHEQGCPWNEQVCLGAASEGHLQCLQYACEQGAPVSLLVSVYAARGGHLECLQYLHSISVAWDEETTIAACEMGNLSCLQFAHTQGCVWTSAACTAAAAGGHLECLMYAVENGCKIDELVKRAAVLNHQRGCVDFLRNFVLA